jgi:threonine synthase
VTRAREIGAHVVVTASTGNAGAALAGMAAAVGHRAVIFAPRTAPPAKIAQLRVYGAEVLLVDGNYDQAFDLSIQVADEFGWYCRNTGYNPFTAEGKKTASFEIWENILLPRYYGRRPLSIFVSVGDGNIISGLHKGFVDLQRIGWLETMPRLYGVQAEGSAAVANAFKAGSDTILPVSAKTVADSISVDLPRDGYRALRAVRETMGGYVVVSDAEILAAITRLGKIGIFAEPAGSAAFAGLVKAISEGSLEPDDPVVVMVTGNGLKDVGAAQEAAGEAPIIEPTLQAVLKHFE